MPLSGPITTVLPQTAPSLMLVSFTAERSHSMGRSSELVLFCQRRVNSRTPLVRLIAIMSHNFINPRAPYVEKNES